MTGNMCQRLQFDDGSCPAATPIASQMVHDSWKLTRRCRTRPHYRVPSKETLVSLHKHLRAIRSGAVRSHASEARLIHRGLGNRV